MDNCIMFKDNEGKDLGPVHVAKHACFKVYKIADVFSCLGIPVAYSTHVQDKIKLGKYLYADWSKFVDYFQRMRQPSGLIIDFMNRREPEHFPEQVKIEFQDTPLVRYLQTLPELTLINVLRNLDLYVINSTLFRMAVGNDVYRALEKFTFSEVANLPASHVAHLLRPALKHLDEVEKEKQKQPIGVEVKDGKLVIQLEINGVGLK